MKIQHRVMLSAAISILVLVSGLFYLLQNQSRAVSVARELALPQAAMAQPSGSVVVRATTPGGALAALEQSLSNSRKVVAGLVVFVLIERSLAVFGLVGLLARQIKQAIAYVRASASGDLRGDLRLDARNELSQVYDAVNHMNAGISTLVRDARAAARRVDQAAQQLNDGNTALAQRTEGQAAALEQTAASMEQFAASVRQSADDAGNAHQMTQGAAAVAEKSANAMRRVEATMQEISASSTKVAEIVTLIDGVAFQTNILALNAAVEAARAGAQGRGFAVVATEVRGLAQRCAQAAKEIRRLIDLSSVNVNDGVASVTEASDSVREIVNGVHEIDQLLAGIAGTAAQQRAGIDQINKAVNQLEHVTQRNSSDVQRATMIADELTREAEALIAAVNRFRLREDGEGDADEPARGDTLVTVTRPALPMR